MRLSTFLDVRDFFNLGTFICFKVNRSSSNICYSFMIYFYFTFAIIMSGCFYCFQSTYGVHAMRLLLK